MSCGLANPVGCVTDVVGGAAQSVADSAFTAVAQDFGQTADSVVNWLWTQIAAATAVTLGGPGFSSEMAITGAIAMTIGLGLFLTQVTVAALRREPGAIARALRGLLIAFVAGGLSIAVVDVGLAAIDSLSDSVVQVATGETIEQMGSALMSPSALTQVSNAAAIILLSLVMVVASVVVWAALMVRKMLIVVAAVFAPIAFAGSLADITSSWVRRWIETMVALIISKLILVLIFAIGLGVLSAGTGQSSQAGATQSLTQLVTGALILAMAGLSPWLAIKLVHFTGDSFHAIHSQAASTSTSAQMVASAPRKLSAAVPSTRSGPKPTGDNPEQQTGSTTGGGGVSGIRPNPGSAAAAGSSGGGPAGTGGASTGAGAAAGTGAAAAAAAAAVASSAAKAAASATQSAAGSVAPSQPAPPGSAANSAPRPTSPTKSAP